MKNKLLLTGGLLLLAGWWANKSSTKQTASVKNAVTLITGGANGIGKATAHAFARHGAMIVIADLEHQLTDTLQHEFEGYTTPVHFIPCDITQTEHRDRLIHEVTRHYEHIDILINNAGVSMGGAFEDLPSASIDKIINVNLTATIHLTQAILPIMKQQNHGHIVNISSVNALMPPPGEAIYSASKSGLNAFSDSLRRELVKTNIRISVVMPALTQTDMLNNVSEDELRDNQLLMSGMSLDSVDQVAGAILSAVQTNQREVICGGVATNALARLAQFRPSAMDWAFKYAIDTERFMQTLTRLGESEPSE